MHPEQQPRLWAKDMVGLLGEVLGTGAHAAWQALGSFLVQGCTAGRWLTAYGLSQPEVFWLMCEGLEENFRVSGSGPCSSPTPARHVSSGKPLYTLQGTRSLDSISVSHRPASKLSFPWFMTMKIKMR